MELFKKFKSDIESRGAMGRENINKGMGKELNKDIENCKDIVEEKLFNKVKDINSEARRNCKCIIAGEASAFSKLGLPRRVRTRRIEILTKDGYAVKIGRDILTMKVFTNMEKLGKLRLIKYSKAENNNVFRVWSKEGLEMDISVREVSNLRDFDRVIDKVKEPITCKFDYDVERLKQSFNGGDKVGEMTLLVEAINKNKITEDKHIREIGEHLTYNSIESFRNTKRRYPKIWLEEEDVVRAVKKVLSKCK